MVKAVAANNIQCGNQVPKVVAYNKAKLDRAQGNSLKAREATRKARAEDIKRSGRHKKAKTCVQLPAQTKKRPGIVLLPLPTTQM